MSGIDAGNTTCPDTDPDVLLRLVQGLNAPLPDQLYVHIVIYYTYSGGASMSSRKKLTLSVDEAVIERARRYSRRHNTSISRLVSNYLSQLDGTDEEVEYSPTVRRLLGILPGDTSLEEYHKHLEEKYSR